MQDMRGPIQCMRTAIRKNWAKSSSIICFQLFRGLGSARRPVIAHFPPSPELWLQNSTRRKQWLRIGSISYLSVLNFNISTSSENLYGNSVEIKVINTARSCSVLVVTTPTADGNKISDWQKVGQGSRNKGNGTGQQGLSLVAWVTYWGETLQDSFPRISSFFKVITNPT